MYVEQAKLAGNKPPTFQRGCGTHGEYMKKSLAVLALMMVFAAGSAFVAAALFAVFRVEALRGHNESLFFCAFDYMSNRPGKV